MWKTSNINAKTLLASRDAGTKDQEQKKGTGSYSPRLNLNEMQVWRAQRAVGLIINGNRCVTGQDRQVNGRLREKHDLRERG